MFRRLTAYRLIKPAARDRRPERNRAFRFIVMTLGAGAVAAVLAIMIAGAPTLLVLAFPTDGSQIQASDLFPKPSPTQKVIDVYDPPPVKTEPPQHEGQPGAEPTEPPENSGGGGDDGGGGGDD